MKWGTSCRHSTGASSARYDGCSCRRASLPTNNFLIFALHLFAAFFGIQAVAVGIGYLSGSRLAAGAFGIGSVLYVLTYMTLALKAVYGGTTRRALAHTLIIAVLYWLATVVTAVAILVPVFVRR